MINAPTRRHTVVLVIEDLHWMDEGSNTMLDEMINSIAGTHTLAMVNFRPEHQLDWDDSPIYRHLSLQPLEQPDTRRDASRHRRRGSLARRPRASLIHERTAGNPFFVEEIVRELVEAEHFEGEQGAYRLVRPVEEAGVPATVQAVLAARIDRLGPDAKQLLQVASVVGKEVGARALGLTAGLTEEELNPALCELVDGGFLYEAELYPERVLAFRHPLTQEVAYGTQLAERREATHAAAARALIEIEADRLDELSALVAHHLEAGGETLEAARWSARAAYWAGHTRPQDAMRLWQRVTALAGELEEDEETTALAVTSRLLQLEYAWRLGMDREEADALAAEATEIAERIGDVHSLALLKLLTKATPGRTEHAAEWIAAAAEAIQLADEAGDPSLRIAVRSGSAYAFMCAGDLDGLERTADELLDLTGGDPRLGGGIVVDCPIAWGLMAKAVALRERDRAEEAEKLLDEAMRLTAEHDDPETEGWARGSKSLLLADRGEAEAALALARRNRELIERFGDVFSLSTALSSMTYVQIAAGEFEGGLETIQLADRLYREAMGSGGETEAWRSTLRARAFLGMGRNAEALEEIEWAARTAERRGMGWQIPTAFHTLAQARAATGAAGVEEALAQAAEAAGERGHLMTLRRIEADRDVLLAAAR